MTSDQRQTPRINTADDGPYDVNVRVGLAKMYKAKTINESFDGVSLSLPMSANVFVGKTVHVHCCGGSIPGVIRWVKRVENRQHVGVALQRPNG